MQQIPSVRLKNTTVHHILHLAQAGQVNPVRTGVVAAIGRVTEQHAGGGARRKHGERLLLLDGDLAWMSEDAQVLVLNGVPSEHLIRDMELTRNFSWATIQQLTGIIPNHLRTQISGDLHIAHQDSGQLLERRVLPLSPAITLRLSLIHI